MATIIYLQENGESQVLTEIENIAQMGIEGNADAQQIAKYIRQGLTQLTNLGIPPNKKMIMIGEEPNGHPRTFNLLKDIVGIHRPLLEFRINRSTPGAFRAIFFCFDFEDEQLLIFTQAVLKQGDPNPPEFQKAVRKSVQMYDEFLKDPMKYLSDFLEEEDD
ncbi:hypothetical protein SAMN05443252_1177 [Bacillus sp. OV322]|uniref:hypothetical protein n=1 Tax=Bacillus sp. OV322 TaxID=1882764 RepID=UPI0008F2955A|nr:hypothetical protein [Bacillus sp. OV322]SFD03457.1 hypothetical protein SAMN05443252_1177 [Bacillus sp. OV322]